MRILTCDDSNADQSIRVHTPNRSYPLDVVPLPASVLPAGGTSGSARSTTLNNTAPTSSNPNQFVAAATANFAQVNGSSLWTFTPAACVWTYTGAAGRRFLFVASSTISPAFESATGTLYMGIDLDSDIIGEDPTTTFVEGIVQRLFTIAETSESANDPFTTSRLVSPAPGSTVRPAFAHPSGDTIITRLSFAFSEVGAS